MNLVNPTSDPDAITHARGRIVPSKPAYLAISGARQYLTAAKHLCAEELDGKPINLPRLHLLAHGIEILCKGAVLLSSEVSEADLRKKPYGHNLLELWRHPDNATLRTVAEKFACSEWGKASQDQRWKGKGSFDKNPVAELHDGIQFISPQHDRESDFILRYPTQRRMAALMPHFMVDTFLSTAEWYLSNDRSSYADGFPVAPVFIEFFDTSPLKEDFS